jgi:hypothetical protein
MLVVSPWLENFFASHSSPISKLAIGKFGCGAVSGMGVFDINEQPQMLNAPIDPDAGLPLPCCLI